MSEIISAMALEAATQRGHEMSILATFASVAILAAAGGGLAFLALVAAVERREAQQWKRDELRKVERLRNELHTSSARR